MIGTILGLARWRWLLPLTWAIGIWWAYVTDLNSVQGRALNASIQGAQSLMFLTCAVAVAAVLAGASVRRNRQRFIAGVRPVMAVTAGIAGVHALIGVTAVLFCAFLILMRAGAPALPSWQPVLLAGFTLAGTSAVGQALGRILPVVVAAPIALLGSYVVLAFPRSFADPMWLRHLAFVDSCCNSAEQVSPQVLAAIAILATSVFLAGLLTAVRAARGLVGFAAAVLVLTLGWQVSTPLVRDLDWSPAVLRTGAVECAQTQSGQICVWPEHAAALPGLVSIWDELGPVAAERGLELPSTLTERIGSDLAYGDGVIGLTPHTPPESYAEVLVIGALPSPETCDSNGARHGALDSAWSLLAHWWLVTAGYQPSEHVEPFRAHDYLETDNDEVLTSRLGTLLEGIRACDITDLP